MLTSRGSRLLFVPITAAAAAALGAPAAHADNKRLNDGVVANVYTIQHQAGCTNDVKINPQLQLAAQRHARDVLNNRNLDGDVGSDGSTPQDRANTAGFHGQVAETVAISPALAINGIDLMNQWYYNPAYFAIMSNCANTQVGVGSENSPVRSVVVAVYGQSQRQGEATTPIPDATRPGSPPYGSENVPLDPSPDYDASDEIEYGLNWLPWILRGVYPPRPTRPSKPPAVLGACRCSICVVRAARWSGIPMAANAGTMVASHLAVTGRVLAVVAALVVNELVRVAYRGVGPVFASPVFCGVGC